MKFCKLQRTTSLDELSEWLSYNENTGVFTWKKSPAYNVASGCRAGHMHKRGRRRIKWHRMVVAEHRLAWLFAYGEWPTDEIDHINGCPSDNRIKNLRVVDHETNMNNMIRIRENGMPPGVNFRPAKYEAIIYCDNKRHWVGWYDTLSEATQSVINSGRKIKGNVWADRMVETYGHFID